MCEKSVSEARALWTKPVWLKDGVGGRVGVMGPQEAGEVDQPRPHGS